MKNWIIEILIENGAHINAKDDKGFSPLHLTCCFTKNCTTWDVNSFSNFEKIKLLLHHGTGVNVQDRHRFTPLHRYSHSFQIAKLLIDFGANLNIRSNNGNTPLHEAAAKNNNIRTVHLLVKNGADINAKSTSGFTSFTMACGIKDKSSNFCIRKEPT